MRYFISILISISSFIGFAKENLRFEDFEGQIIIRTQQYDLYVDTIYERCTYNVRYIPDSTNKNIRMADKRKEYSFTKELSKKSSMQIIQLCSFVADSGKIKRIPNPLNLIINVYEKSDTSIKLRSLNNTSIKKYNSLDSIVEKEDLDFSYYLPRGTYNLDHFEGFPSVLTQIEIKRTKHQERKHWRRIRIERRRFWRNYHPTF